LHSARTARFAFAPAFSRHEGIPTSLSERSRCDILVRIDNPNTRSRIAQRGRMASGRMPDRANR